MKKVLIYTSIGVALAIILFYAVAFFGNPISRVLANKAANDYLETHYTDLELEQERAFYNFKDAKYVVRLQDKNSIDTNFNLRFNSFGKMKRDTYGERLFNTYRRYIDFLYDLGEEIAKDNGLNFEVWLRPDNDFDYKTYLTLDQDFDADNLPSKVKADFKAYAEKPSLDDLMNGLKKVYEALKERDIAASSYSGLVIPNDDKEEDGLSLIHI